MTFNFNLLFAALRKTFWRTSRTDARLTAKRVLAILIVFPGYVMIESINWLGFLLDEVFFPGYRRLPVCEPVFIVGVWRSGTTCLHRLMSQDTMKFSSMKTWEVYLAPSIIQKKTVSLLAAIDRACGQPLATLVRFIEKRLFRSLRQFHAYSLADADEDEFVMIHRFSSLFLMVMFPFPALFRAYAHIDRDLNAGERKAYLVFYQRCVQKHLYVYGRGKQLLAKNPSFSGMIQSVKRVFPDAKIICMIRSPLQVIPSALSMWWFFLNMFLSPIQRRPLLAVIEDIIAWYYRELIEQLDRMNASCGKIIQYDDLVEMPDKIVGDIFRDFGFTMTQEYAEVLRREGERVRSYESKHMYALESFGLSREVLLREYADIFNRFAFGGGR